MKFLAALPILVTLLALSAVAQQPPATSTYGVSVTSSLTSAASVVTIQGNQAANVRLVRAIAFKGFDITCSVACTVTLERDGTAATATSQAIVQLNGESQPATALAFAASNAGVGTVLSQYSVSAGGTIAISLAGKYLVQGFENLTIRTSAITGTVNTNIQFAEQ